MTRGLWHMVGAAICFSFAGMLVKLSKDLPTHEVMFFRGWVSLLFSLPLLLHLRIPLLGKNPGLLFLRGLTGCISLLCYFYTLQTMPLAEAATLQYLNPIFTSVFAIYMLRERWHASEWKACVGAFIGVVVLTQPQIPRDWTGVAIAISGAVFSGISYNLVRLSGLAGEHPLTTSLYFPVVATLLTAPPSILQWVPPTLSEWIILVAMGISTQLGQIYLTSGLKLETASRAMIATYLVIVISALMSWALGDPTNLQTYAGIGIVLVAMASITRKK